MSSVDVSRDRVETLAMTENLQKLLEALKSQILDKVEAAPAEPTMTIPTPDVGMRVADEVQEKYYSKMQSNSRLHAILDPPKLPVRSAPTIFIVQEGTRHIPAESSFIILPILKIGQLETRIVTAPADDVDVMLEPDGTLTAVAGKARIRSSGKGKLAYFAIAYVA